MFVAQKPIKYYEPRRGGTLIKLFKGTCRPYGLRSSFSALCYKHAAPTEIDSRRNFNGLISYYFAFLLSPFNFSIAFSRLSEETKILAQEVARLDREQRRVRKAAVLESVEPEHGGLPVNAGANGDSDSED